jgi:peptide/nickel transport system ATP-binding protein
VEQLLGQVGLPAGFADRYPGELSGGQQQRIGVARALAAGPDLLVLDEVTSALDPLVAAELLDLLEGLRRDTGTAYLLITHDLGVARRVADQVAVMRAGRVVDLGTVGEVLDRPRHPYTARLTAAVPQARAGWLDEALGVAPPGMG